MSCAIPSVLAIGISSEILGLLPGSSFQLEEIPIVSSGLDRLAAASAKFDVVLMNLGLTSDCNLEAFTSLHAVFPNIPVVLLTDATHEAQARKGLLLGAQDFLLLPEVTALTLASALSKAVLRHRSQNAARRDRHFLEVLMEKIPDAIYFKDAESHFLRISRAQARKFNLSDPVAAVGRSDADFFSQTHALQALADEQETMRTGQPLVDIEEQETWPDGTITWVSTTKMALRNHAGEIIGTFGISRDITARKIAELALAERTTQLQQKNRQIQEELNMARELQLAMLPQAFSFVQPTDAAEPDAVDFFSCFFPSGAVSGDFFDIIKLSDTAVGVFVCDAMGHDVRAALVTAMVRSLVRDLSDATTDPGELLGQINRAVSSVFRQTGATMFATAFYAVVDLAAGELRYASAAHADALHLRGAFGDVDPLIGKSTLKGPALGLFEKALFPTSRRPLDASDFIVLFTDGLVEAAGPDQECYSQERLAAALRRHRHLPAKELIETVIGEVRSFCENGQFDDDVSLVGLKVNRLLLSPAISRKGLPGTLALP